VRFAGVRLSRHYQIDRVALNVRSYQNLAAHSPQLHDLFEVARVNLRVREPGHALSGFPSVDEWVSVFKQKRDEIVSKRCA